MYGLKVYITPKDIIDKLSNEDKKRFNQCVFTDVTREMDGSITIDCIVFDDPDPYVRERHRQRYFNEGLAIGSNNEKNFCIDVDIDFPCQYIEEYANGELELDDAINKTTNRVHELIHEYIDNHKI